MVCLHATDPATVYMSAWARVDGMTVQDLEQALYVDRSLVKHLAMRRTLFVFPREALPVVQAAASDRVAAAESRRLVRDVEKAGLFTEGDRWLRQAGDAVLTALADGREASASQLRKEIALLQGATTYGVGKSWGGQVPVGPRVLTVLSAGGRVVRATNEAGWAVSRPRWARFASWLGHEIARVEERQARARLVHDWLRAFGPGTAQDIKWWLGSTVAAVRTALADLDAVVVDLDGRPGYLLPDDLERTEPVEPWAALLPGLDPTTMGWVERGWYLGGHKSEVFDSNGNAGPTAWWDGRIVGGWHQDPAGEVVLDLLEDVGAEATGALELESQRLTGWLAGAKVPPRFPSPLSKRLRVGGG